MPGSRSGEKVTRCALCPAVPSALTAQEPGLRDIWPRPCRPPDAGALKGRPEPCNETTKALEVEHHNVPCILQHFSRMKLDRSSSVHLSSLYLTAMRQMGCWAALVAGRGGALQIRGQVWMLCLV